MKIVHKDSDDSDADCIEGATTYQMYQEIVKARQVCELLKVCISQQFL